MKKVIKKIFGIGLISSMFLSKPALAISLLNASDPFMNDCLTTGNCNLCHFVAMFIQASDVLIYISGIMAVAMFIYGGIVLITSYGNESRVTWGKNTIAATVIGIFIVMTAWTLINTLLFSLYGNNTGKFSSIINVTFGSHQLSDWGGVCSNAR